MLKSYIFRPLLIILTFIIINSCETKEEEVTPALGIFVNVSGDDLSFYAKPWSDLINQGQVSFSRLKSDLNRSGITIVFDAIDDLNTISYPYTIETFYLNYEDIPDPTDYLNRRSYSNSSVDADLYNTTLILTGYKNKILTGTFSGTLYQKLRNNPPIDVNTPNITITEGSFGIDFRLQ